MSEPDLVWRGPADVYLADGHTCPDRDGNRAYALHTVWVALEGGYVHIRHTSDQAGGRVYVKPPQAIKEIVLRGNGVG